MDSGILTPFTFAVPSSATPNLTMKQWKTRIWVSEWAVMERQILFVQVTVVSTFSSGEEFSSTKNKQIEVGEAMQSSSKQNKSIKL